MTIQLTEARIAEMLEALVQVVYRVGLLQQHWSELYAPHQYAPDSKAAATMKVAQNQEWCVRFRAWFVLCSAADHIIALERTLDPKQMLSFSPWTTARNVLDASQQAAWLLMPDIEETERVARGFALMRRSVKATIRFINTVNENDDPRSTNEIFQKIDEVEKTLGIKKTSVEFGNILGASDRYHLLSGVVHHNMEIQKLTSQKRIDLPGETIFQPDLSLESRHDLIKSPLQWYSIPVWWYFNYCGFGLDELESILREAGNIVGLPHQFWLRTPESRQ